MTLFSVPLLRLTAAYAIGSPYFSPEVPTGYVWVVRDIAGLGGSLPDDEIAVAIDEGDGSLVYFYAWSDADSSAFNNTFHWKGRQVLDAGERLRVDVDGGGIWLAASGYQLSTP